MPTCKPTIRIDYPDLSAGEKKAIRAVVKSAVNTTLRQTAADVPDHSEVAIVIAGDAAIQELNHTFRGKNIPTNILSFPSDEADYLGDIIISLDTIEREAAAQEKSLPHHLTHMVIHGILHLLGYDHENEDEAAQMESLEISILTNLGIDNPYR